MILTFDKAWMDAYWATISPDILQCVKLLEANESWVVDEVQQVESFQKLNQVAAELPVLATLPISEHTEAKVFDLMKILTWLPIRSSIAGLAWLTALANEPQTWTSLIYRLAREIVSGNRGIEDGEIHHQCASIIVQRVDLITFLSEFNDIFLTTPSLGALMNAFEKRLNIDA